MSTYYSPFFSWNLPANIPARDRTNRSLRQAHYDATGEWVTGLTDFGSTVIGDITGNGSINFDDVDAMRHFISDPNFTRPFWSLPSMVTARNRVGRSLNDIAASPWIRSLDEPTASPEGAFSLPGNPIPEPNAAIVHVTNATGYAGGTVTVYLRLEAGDDYVGFFGGDLFIEYDSAILYRPGNGNVSILYPWWDWDPPFHPAPPPTATTTGLSSFLFVLLHPWFEFANHSHNMVSMTFHIRDDVNIGSLGYTDTHIGVRESWPLQNNSLGPISLIEHNTVRIYGEPTPYSTISVTDAETGVGESVTVHVTLDAAHNFGGLGRGYFGIIYDSAILYRASANDVNILYPWENFDGIFTPFPSPTTTDWGWSDFSFNLFDPNGNIHSHSHDILSITFQVRDDIHFGAHESIATSIFLWSDNVHDNSFSNVHSNSFGRLYLRNGEITIHSPHAHASALAELRALIATTPPLLARRVAANPAFVPEGVNFVTQPQLDELHWAVSIAQSVRDDNNATLHDIWDAITFLQGEISHFNMMYALQTGTMTFFPDLPTLTVSSPVTWAGNEVTVQVRLDNNPGFASKLLRVAFHDNLTLVRYELGHDDLLNRFTGPEVNGNEVDPGEPTSINGHFFLGWAGRTTNFYNDGTILYLTFAVSPGLPPGTLPINITFENAHDIELPSGVDRVPFNVQILNGGVIVRQRLVGDVNGDGRRTSLDVTYIALYLIDEIDLVNRLAADVDGDGYITMADIILFSRWLVGHDVSLVE